jgi:hypothetical protein
LTIVARALACKPFLEPFPPLHAPLPIALLLSAYAGVRVISVFGDIRDGEGNRRPPPDSGVDVLGDSPGDLVSPRQRWGDPIDHEPATGGQGLPELQSSGAGGENLLL